jgi:hypothetical protein
VLSPRRVGHYKPYYCLYKHTNPRTASIATLPLHRVHRMNHIPFQASTATNQQMHASEVLTSSDKPYYCHCTFTNTQINYRQSSLHSHSSEFMDHRQSPSLARNDNTNTTATLVHGTHLPIAGSACRPARASEHGTVRLSFRASQSGACQC